MFNWSGKKYAYLRWLFTTSPFVVSINLSARELVQADLAATLQRALDESGVRPEHIGIEITESMLMEDVESGIGAIHELRHLGVRVSIDDFGTGYSSLGYLKRLPVDAVKIDRSFVAGLGTDGEDSAIVTAVVSLGHALGLSVVAEGVETEQHVRELVRLGCDHAQGFFFAPPQPSTDLRSVLTRSWRPPGRSLIVSDA
jgi:EAL domain-containing protein (putative c-di-GMP-specific phosphodiesterase class I)